VTSGQCASRCIAQSITGGANRTANIGVRALDDECATSYFCAQSAALGNAAAWTVFILQVDMDLQHTRPQPREGKAHPGLNVLHQWIA
jgi:hypothetical protein